MDPLKLMRYALAGWLPGGSRACAMCGHKVWRYMPYRRGSRGAPPLMRALDGVGSDVDHFECPRCGAHDRERHLLLYMRASTCSNAWAECACCISRPNGGCGRALPRRCRLNTYVATCSRRCPAW
jgi:hypothetical protein